MLACPGLPPKILLTACVVTRSGIRSTIDPDNEDASTFFNTATLWILVFLGGCNETRRKAQCGTVSTYSWPRPDVTASWKYRQTHEPGTVKVSHGTSMRRITKHDERGSVRSHTSTHEGCHEHIPKKEPPRCMQFLAASQSSGLRLDLPTATAKATASSSGIF